MACEKCWGDAYKRSLVDGRAQSEHYRELLEERKDNPCTHAEQDGHLCWYCGKPYVAILSHAMNFYKYCSNACEDDAYTTSGFEKGC